MTTIDAASSDDGQPVRTAVLTIELQRGVVGDLSPIVELRRAVTDVGLLESVRRLLEAARRASVPVVHATVGWRSDRLGTPLVTPIARHLARDPGHMLEGSPAVDLDPEIGPDPDVDLISHRHHGMAPFTGTTLDALMRSMGVTHLVICGVSLNVGVLGAVIEAVGLGYEVTVATDAVTGVPVDYGQAVLRHSLSPLASLATTEDLERSWSIYRTTT